MPLYSLECPQCRQVSEHLMGMDDNRTLIKCTYCAGPMNRNEHRAYYADPVMIIGDTCSGGCNFSGYYDEGLGAYVSSRTHRKNLMAAKGLTEYVPDPMMSAARKEAKYIRANAPENDPAAMHAAKDQSKVAHDKRTERVIDAALAKARKEI